VDRLWHHLPAAVADVVLFFFCPWRIGPARRLEWRDYSPIDQALTLRPELNKTKREVQIPVDPEHTPELMAIIERQLARRRPDCPFIFHGKLCGTARFDQARHPPAMPRGLPKAMGPRVHRHRLLHAPAQRLDGGPGSPHPT